MKSSYGERDYLFGQAMLKLRTDIGLTQEGLANHLGVSRRAVGEWEAGSSYPKAEHLKEVIALGVKQKAFPIGHEAEEIRTLWNVARQKVRLDERWLSALLDQQCSPHLRIVPPHAGERAQDKGLASLPMVPVTETMSGAAILGEPTLGPRVDWDDALAVPTFYGREDELALLSQWILQEHCCLVSVLGMGGIGKSALSVNAMHQLAGHFEVVIFRSLRDAPSCDALVAQCLEVVSPQPIDVQPTNLERCISLLLSHLRKTRVLMVLDNLEALLQEGDLRGRWRSGFEGYGLLLRRVAETTHQSCLLLTSREKLAELRCQESKHSPVRALRLNGLDVTACQQLFMEKELVGTEADQKRLIDLYAGNPMALKIVAETIIDLFGGEISEFLVGGTAIFGSISDLLGEQFVRLSALEQSVLYWLAIVREPLTLDELLALLVTPRLRVQVLEAIDGLYRRSLIERGKRLGSFTLQSVVLEYVVTALIAEVSREIQQHRFDRLIEHGLSQAMAREDVRQSQVRLLISPLLADLQCTYRNWPDGVEQDTGGTVPNTCDGVASVQTYGVKHIGYGACPTTPMSPVEKLLLGLLDELRELEDSAQGYGPANVIALLQLYRGHLSGLDLSKLCIRGSSLQGIEMQETSLCGALIRDTVFTEAVSATWGVAISKDAALWAAGGMKGEVRVWREKGRILHLMLHAHSDVVRVLAFSPNGQILASGSQDGTVKLWDVESGALLWMGWQNGPQAMAFSPDGNLLACSGLGETVRLWDTCSGTNLQNLEHPAHVFGVAWSPDGSLLVSSCFDGQLRFWERCRDRTGASPVPTRLSDILRISTSWKTSPVRSLAFAPDGRTLAGADWDRQVKLWEVGSGRLLHTFEGVTNKMNKVVWSPDGRTLASSSYEKAIRLWDVEQRCHRATLCGHTSDINGMAFTPDSSCLLSGGTDSTLRLWDVENGQCMRVMQGYAVSHYCIDWSPDSTHLVSSGTDGVVTIWDLGTERPPKELRGHTWLVWGVGWSPDGRLVASSGWDRVLRLWKPTTLSCVRVFREPSTPLLGLAWSLDGSLLAVATFLQGMYIWDVRAGRPRWIGAPSQTAFLSAAWGPDGSLLAGGSNDGNVYLWKGADGTCLQRLPGHRGNVMSLAWSPDGTRLASGGGELFVWDVQACRGNRKEESDYEGPTALPVRTFAEHSAMVYAVAWSRSQLGARHGLYDSGGDQLISGGGDGILRWWDVKTGKCVNMQDACHGTIRSLKVSPDGKSLASCGDDGAIRIWDLCSGGEVQGGVSTAPPLLRTLRRARPYEGLNITGIRGLNEAQKNTLQALGAIDEAVSSLL